MVAAPSATLYLICPKYIVFPRKIAVITGGSRGIGKMIAAEFVRRGVRTYITARKADACQQTAKELSEHGECIAWPHDLSTVNGIEAFVADVSAREQQLDILINKQADRNGAHSPMMVRRVPPPAIALMNYRSSVP